MLARDFTYGWTYNDFSSDPFATSYINRALSAYPFKAGALNTADLAISAVERMIEDCSRFRKANENLLVVRGFSTSDSLTRAGTAFWDVRNNPQQCFPIVYWGLPVGPILTKAAIAFDKCRLYVGVDGLVYVYSEGLTDA